MAISRLFIIFAAQNCGLITPATVERPWVHILIEVYNKDTYECYIPNKEVADEMNNAIIATSWTPLANTIQNSKFLLDATIVGNENAVAQAIDIAHDENTSILAYNDENSLASVITIAYIWARNEYVIHRELPLARDMPTL